MCKSVQISGQPASEVIYAQEDGYKNQNSQTPPLGPGQYDLMIIGDKPMFEDDKRDIFFQDPSSEVITSYLQNAGIDLKRTYMTKIIRCKPKARRKPTVQEINTCRDEYLRKEIELIQPKVVMLVGAESLRAFNLNGRGPINSIRGKVFEEQFAGWDDGPTFKVIPTLNPAVFFYKRNDRLKARVQQDYILAKNILEGKEPNAHFIPDWELIDSPEKLEWLESELAKVTLIGFDTESPILSWRKSPLLSIQISWDWDKTAVIPIHRHDPNAPEDQQFHVLPAFGALNENLVKGFVHRVFGNPNLAKAAHNFKYDENVLRWHYGVKIQGFRFDTLVMKHLMDENPPSDLEFLCDLYFFWGDYSAKRREITGQGKKLIKTFDKVPDKILWPYGATDALGTYRLACVFTQKLKTDKPNLWQFYQEESATLIKALAKAEYKGAVLDLDMLDKLKDEYELEQKKLLTHMRSMLWPDFNSNSNEQVLKAFFNLGVSSVDLEDQKASSGYSANKNKLVELIDKGGKVGDLAEKIMIYRNRQKMISTYLVNALNDLDVDGRVRYSWTQAGPVTGRLSCRFFHQIPKIDRARVKAGKPIMRDLFIAPKGYKYVYGDLSQVELRIMATLAQDPEMLRILDAGDDLHAATAFEFLSTVWPGLKEENISKFNRTEVGKRINFGLAYGSEGHALVKTGKWQDADGKERNFTWDMLNKGMLRWRQRFSGIGKFIDLMPDIVRGYGGTATNAFGRERHFGSLLNVSNDYERGKAERECVNFFIQSVAAAMTNRIIIAVDEMLERFEISEDVVCLVNTVHDSVAYEVRDDYVEWFQQALRAIASQPWPQVHNKVFPMDIGVGQNWTQAELAG